ncbi:MAG: insulinase family protein [Deltaproteobacteria bacterium]|nr:MAG: insulinase family protein [Deltaproteobacteria bacterium]
MITLLSLSFALAQEPAEATAEATPAEETTEAEAPTGPDRSQRPAVELAEPLELAEPEVHAIGDAVTVHLVPLEGVRKVEIAVMTWRGTLDVDGWPTWPGRAAGELMDVATDSRDPEAIELLSAMHDLSVFSTSTGVHDQSLYMEVPRVDLEVGLDLLADTLRNPAYPGKETKRYRRESAFYWQYIAASDLGTLASQARSYAWFPEDHPYGARRDLAELKLIKPSELSERNDKVWHAGPIDVLVVGDVTWADVEAPLTAMLGDLGAPGERKYAPSYDGLTESRIVAVDMPGEQAALRLRMAGPRFDHADRDTAKLVDFALGGHFLSRLNSNLREDKGFTYGSGSRLSSGRSAGIWDIGVDVKVENVAAAMTEIENELAKLAESGVTEGEIGAAVRERVQGWNRTRLTASTGSNLYSGLLDDEETAAEARERLASLSEIPIAETQRVAAEWLGTDAARLWVVVGDRAQLEGPLAEKGIAVEWITPEEAVLGGF